LTPHANTHKHTQTHPHKLTTFPPPPQKKELYHAEWRESSNHDNSDSAVFVGGVWRQIGRSRRV